LTPPASSVPTPTRSPSPANGTSTSPIHSGFAPPPRDAYQGETTNGSCPSATRARGSEPTTSPRPPALLYGVTSADANRTRMPQRLAVREPGPRPAACVRGFTENLRSGAYTP